MTSASRNIDFGKMSEAELMKHEREIARKYIDTLSIPMVVWPLVNTTIWLVLWPLVILGQLPLWAGFLIATINITLSYLPSHDAQHDCFARPGEKLRWLNEFIGHYSLIPLARGYAIMKRHQRLDHHQIRDAALMRISAVFLKSYATTAPSIQKAKITIL